MDTKIDEEPQALKPHPAAEIFPMMVGDDLAALVDDIRRHGQVEPIVVLDGLILDGRHRHRACMQLGIEPITVPWEGPGTPESFVISKNLHRRHLDASQRAMAAAAFATLKRGGDKLSANLRKAPTAAEVAALFNVSTRSIESARIVRIKGAPELAQAVERGAIKVSTAAELVELPKDRQRELATAGKYLVSKTVKGIRKTEATRRARAEAKHTKPEKSEVPKPSSNNHRPIDLCAMEVRRIVLAAIREMSNEDATALIAELRDELDDIEKVAEKRRSARSSVNAAETKIDVISPPGIDALPKAPQVERG